MEAMNKTVKTFACAILAACALSAPAIAQDRNTISWSGQVDDTVIVRVHRDHVRTYALHGASPVNVTSNVFDPLPSSPVHVWLTQVHGRGAIRVIQEPSFENDYTAVIRLKDRQNGPEYYSFVLKWHEGNGTGDRDNDHDNDNDNR
jgi:hypothetical protein